MATPRVAQPSINVVGEWGAWGTCPEVGHPTLTTTTALQDMGGAVVVASLE